jgi:capsular exopolysaccharide synthesis family protein
MLRKRDPEPKPTIFTYYDNESAGATEFRRLARNVEHASNPSDVRSILVTSAAKDEGKTLIAANLAIAIAKKNKKVLLVDCDLRRAEVHWLFGMEREPGFASLLTGEMEPNDVARDTELDNLKVIPSGRVVDSPSQLLASAKDILDRCKEQFDVLVCDSPPIVPVDDAGILAPHVDGVLMVVLAGKTDRMVVKRAIEILHDANARVLGVALNNMHGTLPYYYDYRYYRYKYERKELPRETDGALSE